MTFHLQSDCNNVNVDIEGDYGLTTATFIYQEAVPVPSPQSPSSLIIIITITPSSMPYVEGTIIYYHSHK